MSSNDILLGNASPFAVLAGSTITNIGPTSITGDIGVSPGNAIVGFPPGVVVGTIHAGDGVALAAQTDLVTAYNTAASAPSTANLTGIDLGFFNAANPLPPGVYTFDSSAGLTGNLTLDAGGDPTAVWIFQIGSTLTTASGSSVTFLDGLGCPGRVYWQVGSSATLGTTTDFIGNIFALTSITLTTGATINGRALARNGAVTLDSNIISNAVAIACICLAANTQILLADGTVKLIQDIQRGDLVADGYMKRNRKVARLTTQKFTSKDLINIIEVPPHSFGPLIPSQSLLITPNHPIINKEARTPAKCFTNLPGVIDHNQVSAETILPEENGQYNLYDIQFEQDGSYYANGLLVQSRSPRSEWSPLPKELYFDSELYTDEVVWDTYDHPLPLVNF